MRQAGPRPSRLAAVFIATPLLLTLRVRSAAAHDPEPIRIDYRAPSSCPDVHAMFTRLRARLDVRDAVGDESARQLRVTISAEYGRWLGTITTVDQRGERSGRALAGSNCAEVVDALALVAAMAMQPELRATASLLDGAPADASTRREERRSAEANTAVDREPARQARSSGLQLFGGAQGEGIAGYVPGVLLGAGARLTVSRVAGRRIESSASVAVSAFAPRVRGVLEGSATLTWTVGQLTACPARLAIARSLSLLPCARADIGRIHAVGRVNATPANAASGPQERNVFWLAAGAVVQLAWLPVRSMMFDWQTAVLLPLTPYEFNFDSGSVIYRAPRVGLSTSIGVAVLFL